jgi:hypothetical protein
LKPRKKNGRPKILPPAGDLPSEDQTRARHDPRATGRTWNWRRRMEAGEFGTVRDLAKAVGPAERHVSRQPRLAYPAPDVLKRLVYRREAAAVTIVELVDIAWLPRDEQEGAAFKRHAGGVLNRLGPVWALFKALTRERSVGSLRRRPG